MTGTHQGYKFLSRSARTNLPCRLYSGGCGVVRHILRTRLIGRRFSAASLDRLSTMAATSFKPIIQGSVGPFSKMAFKAALAAQPGRITCPRSRNDKPCRLDLAVLDDF